MRTLIAAGLLWIGCASPAKIRLGAEREQLKARQLDEAGDRYGAAKASAAAEKQYEKATARASAHMASSNTIR
jgi:hypothetical protein